MHAQRRAGRERQNRNRDRRARHVDGRTEGDRYAERVFGKLQLAAQIHVDRNVRRRRTGEERHHAGLTQGDESKRIGILASADPNDDGVQNQRHEEEAPDEKHQKLRVPHERAEPFGRKGVRDQPVNAQGRETDHHVHDEFHAVGKIVKRFTGTVRSLLHRNAETHAPGKNADVISV